MGPYDLPRPQVWGPIRAKSRLDEPGDYVTRMNTSPLVAHWSSADSSPGTRTGSTPSDVVKNLHPQLPRLAGEGREAELYGSHIIHKGGFPPKRQT